MLSPVDTERREEGFSLLELVIVLMLASIVLAVAAGALISLDNATTRHDSAVQEEQAASVVMADMERDIRSASAVSIPADASATDQLQLAELNSDGSTTDVLWKYDPTAQTLSRQTASDGSFQPSGDTITKVTNGPDSPVFRYYDSRITEIPAASTSQISTCATAVGVDVKVSSPTRGVGSFEETAEVALTNQVQSLTTPGNGQCGSP